MRRSRCCRRHWSGPSPTPSITPTARRAALVLSHEAALALLGDVLDLAHRLPRVWALVDELRVAVHLARRAAQESRDLSVEAVDHADRLLAWRPRRLNPHRVGVLDEARLYADPDRAVADHDAALASRRVDVDHDQGAPGCSQVLMLLDTADAIGFDATVSTVAATMGALGHPGSLDVPVDPPDRDPGHHRPAHPTTETAPQTLSAPQPDTTR